MGLLQPVPYASEFVFALNVPEYDATSGFAHKGTVVFYKTRIRSHAARYTHARQRLDDIFATKILF